MNNPQPSSEQKSVRVAFIGMGDRGRTALRLMAMQPEVRVVALCDLSLSNLQQALALLKDLSAELPRCLDGVDAYKVVCQADDVDLIYVCSGWDTHTRLAIEALNGGKDVAIEVPAATTFEEIRALVDAARKARRQCMLLENVCFEQQVVDAIAAIRRGDIGEVVHAEGSYYHRLGERWAPWRLEANRQQRGDLYPTHELGPICQALGIGRDDHLQTLVSMDSAPLSGPQAYEAVMHTAAPDFQNGDHTCTLMRTQRGRTILLKHDVLTEQPYERQLTFIGTHGRITLNDEGKASHEQMTLNMIRHLVHCLVTGEPWPITLDDLATWCAVVPLSRQSIENSFTPLPFPTP